MIFGRKFLGLIALLGGGVGVGQAIRSGGLYDSGLPPGREALLAELTRNLRDVHLDANVDPHVGSMGDSKFIYSLFGTNLVSFSSAFSDYFYRWALRQWARWMLNGTAPGSFPDVKNRIYEALKKVEYKPHLDASGTPFDPEHWTRENNEISAANKDLGNAFTSFFFDTLWKKTDNSDIERSDDDLQSYGDLTYAKAMVDFQKFVLDEWMARKKPVFLCRKSWEFSSRMDSGLYKDASVSKPSFDFPDFREKKDEIINFTTDGSCTAQIFTVDDLETLDGRETDAFISKYFLEINTTDANGKAVAQGTDYTSPSDATSLMDIFTVDSQPDSTNISQPSSEVISDDGALKDKKSKHFLSWRKVKFGSTGGKTGTYVRTQKGITFLHYDASHSNAKLKLLQESENNQLSTTLKTFFVSRAGELIGKYLARDNLPLPAGIFGNRTWNLTLYELAKQVSLFAEELAKNKAHWSTTVKLSSAVKDYAKATFSSSKPDPSAGLGLPLWLKRNLDTTTSILPNKQSSSAFLSDLSSGNDGVFPLVKAYYDKDWKPETLNQRSKALKKALADHLRTFRHPRVIPHPSPSPLTRSSYHLGDYIMDNVYRTLLTKDEGKFLKKATTSLLLAKNINFDFNTNNLKSFSYRLLSDNGLSSSEDLNELFLNSLKDVYYGTQYFSEDFDSRISYGGFKYTKPTKDCIRRIQTPSNDKSPQAPAPAPESCATDLSNRREWRQKLTNYWLSKNYVYGEYGYELASDQFSDYIKYLHTVHHLTQNKFSDLRSFVSSSIPSGRHGALIWMDRVTNLEAGDIGELDGQNSPKSLDKYFRATQQHYIFNPFFNRSLSVSDTPKSPLDTGHIGAFAKSKDSRTTELFGFAGLFTETLSPKELPDAVFNAAFAKFKDSNPVNNKNYLSPSQSHTSGLAFGELMTAPTLNLEKRIDEISTASALKNFLQEILSGLVDEVWNEVDRHTGTKGALDLAAIKAKVKTKLKQDKYSNQINSLTSRFSGLLQNPDKEESTQANKPLFIYKENDNHAHLVYMIQVNKYDFQGGFSSFVDTIGTDTFLKTVLLLASRNQAIQRAVNRHLSVQGLII